MALISIVDPDFWTLYHSLPRDIRLTARRKHRLWQDDPEHPCHWFWIGAHHEYDQVLRRR